MEFVKRSLGDKVDQEGGVSQIAQEMKEEKMKLKVSNAPERASQIRAAVIWSSERACSVKWG